MIAFVDPDLCIGCTQCAGLCPAVFRMEGVLADFRSLGQSSKKSITIRNDRPRLRNLSGHSY